MSEGLPRRIEVAGRVFRLTPLRVEDFYEDAEHVDVPQGLTLIPDDVVVELSEDTAKNRFIMVYISEKTVDPGARK